MYQKYYEEVYQALQSAGEGGLTVGYLAKAINYSKSHAWKVANEMVTHELIQRVEVANTHYRMPIVIYRYLQIPLPFNTPYGWKDSDRIFNEFSEGNEYSNNPVWAQIQRGG